MSFDLKLEGGTIKLNDSGDLERVQGLSKLIQDTVKIVVTPLGTHSAHPWYGSNLTTGVVGRAFSNDVLHDEAVAATRTAISNLISLQQSQIRAGQYLSPDETIGRIVDIAVGINPSDSRQIYMLVKIQAKSGKIINEEVGVVV